jgi:hypothetical protein
MGFGGNVGFHPEQKRRRAGLAVRVDALDPVSTSPSRSAR